nr:bridge-like lipid transfer protein family member 2 [Lytechinus pictus]
MTLSYFLFYLIFITLLLAVLSRLSAIVVSNILSKVLKKSISIEYFGFFSLKSIAIQLPKSSIEIDCIWISWRLFNSQQLHPMALHIGDVRVRAELSQEDGSLDDLPPRRPPPHPGPIKPRSGISKFILSSLPTLIQYAAQLSSFHIEAVNVMLLGAMGTDSLLHVTVNDASLTGQAINER